MKAVIAIDSFKGSFSSQEAAQTVAAALATYQIDSDQVVIADGGEGTMAAILANSGGEVVTTTVQNSRGEEISAQYGWQSQTQTAIIDSAEASGIQFAKHNGEFVDARTTSSIGTGQLVAAALKNGAQCLVVGLGGTGTTDAGVGLLGALGAKFYDQHDEILPPIVTSLGKISRVELPQLPPSVELISCTDVVSPLIGLTGAVQMFGPQKGVTEEQLPQFEADFTHFAQIVDPDNQGQIAGDGAAGGLGFALRMLDAQVVSGFDYVATSANLVARIQEADLVITGEGKLDKQSLQGKVPIKIAELAQKAGKPCLAFVGRQDGELSLYQRYGLTSVFPIVDRVMTLEEALATGLKNLDQTALRVGILLRNLLDN